MPHSKYDSLKLNGQLCFPLYACSREIIRLYTPYLNQLDLTYTQYITMMALWEHRSLTVKELGTILYLDSGTLTPLLKKLESKGYLSRARSHRDERNLIVSLTPEGEELKDRALAVPLAMEQQVTMTAQEYHQLSSLLHKLISQCRGGQK